MFFCRKFCDNLWNPEYYRAILTRPLSSAFAYYLKMSLWLVLCYTAFVSLFFVPDMVRFARTMVTDFGAAYPSDLVIRLSNGQASVNRPEPIVMPLPPSASRLFNFNAARTGKVIGNLAVIDTRKNFVLTEFAGQHSLFVLNKDALGADTGASVQVTPVLTGGSTMIDKSFILSLAERVRRVIALLAPFSVLAVYLFGIAFFAFTLLPILLTALAAWVLLLIASRGNLVRPRFAQALSVTLHAVTLSLVVNFFTFLVYPVLSLNIPFMFTISLLVIYANLIRKQKIVFIPPVAPKEIAKDTITSGPTVENNHTLNNDRPSES
ncbi:MAG: DUF1189 family protein [Candidatus Vogelbacteria bacterium]|nr:DUF1189 family protein [Candidatus Vogelbacteria bacterium]